MNREKALTFIESSSKRDHSLTVSRIMVQLAKHHGHDPSEWELAGLLHDLDYDETTGNREMHGIIASNRLEGNVSEHVLQAIRCHDHRTGIPVCTLLDRSLRFADAVSVLIEETSTILQEKPWLREIIEGYELTNGLSLDKLITLVSC